MELFYDGSKKLTYLEATKDCSCYGDDYCSCEITITQQDVTTWEKLEGILRNIGVAHLVSSLANSKDSYVTSQFNKALKAAGWVNYDTVKGQKDKVMLQERFYMLTGLKGTTTSPYSYYNSIQEVDLNELSEYDAEKLADKNAAMLVQKITTTSLKTINPKAYKAYLAESKKRKAASERAKKAAETRKQKKLEKELAKARKLLEEAGEV